MTRRRAAAALAALALVVLSPSAALAAHPDAGTKAIDDQIVLTDLRLLETAGLPQGLEADDGPNETTEVCVKATFSHTGHLDDVPGVVAGCFDVTWDGKEQRLIGPEAPGNPMWLGPMHAAECAPSAPWTVSVRVVEADQLGVDEVVRTVGEAFGGERAALAGDAGRLLDRAFDEMFPPPAGDLGESDVAFASGEGDTAGTTTRAPAPSAAFRYSVDKVVRQSGACKAGGAGTATSTTDEPASSSSSSSTATTEGPATTTTEPRTTTTSRRTTTTTTSKRTTTTSRRTTTTKKPTTTTTAEATTTTDSPTTTAVEGDTTTSTAAAASERRTGPPSTRLAAAVAPCTDAEPMPFCTTGFDKTTGWDLLRQATSSIAPVDDEPDAARTAPRSREVRRALIRYVGSLGGQIAAADVDGAAAAKGADLTRTRAAQTELTAAAGLMERAIDGVDPTILRTALTRFEHAQALALQSSAAAPDDSAPGGSGTSTATRLELALLVVLLLVGVALATAWFRQGPSGRHSRGTRRLETVDAVEESTPAG